MSSRRWQQGWMQRFIKSWRQRLVQSWTQKLEQGRMQKAVRKSARKESSLQRLLLGLVNNLTRSLLLVVALLGLSMLSCSRFLKDERKVEKKFELDIQGSQCLYEIPKVLTNYFQQSLNVTELHDTSLCVDKALMEFLQSTKGIENGVYQSHEVQRFFQKYVFKREISEELTHEIMKLKAAMLGGTDEIITRSEFERLRALLRILEVEMLRVYPHLNIYLMRESVSVLNFQQKGRLDIAIADLRRAIQNLVSGLHLAESEYSLPEVDLLFGEIQKFAGITDPNDPFLQWRRNLPTLEKLKTLLVGEVVELRSQREISEIWNVLIDVYRLGLQYQAGIDKLNWMTQEHFPEFDAWVEDLFAILDKGIALRNKGQIPFKRIDEIIDEFYGRQLWIKPLKPTSAKMTYRQILTRFLDSSSNELMAVDMRHLHELQREYRAFKLVQKGLSAVFSKKPLRPRTEVIAAMENYSISEDIKGLSPYSQRDQGYFVQAWKEYLTLLRRPTTAHWDHSGRVFYRKAKGELWTYQELSRLNLLRGITSVFFRAYGVKAGVPPLENSVTVDQLRKVFSEFQDFGGELGFFDLRNSDSAGRSTREADLFTPSGNGDGSIQYNEMLEMFAILWSGGFVGVSNFKRVAGNDGCLLGMTEDYFHWPYLNMDCASNSFRRNFSAIFPHLTEFSKFVAAMPDDHWKSFFDDLLNVSRVCPNDPVGLETGDQRTMVVVLQYIENLFIEYDHNKNETLDESEVDAAFPRFKEFMVDVVRRRVKEYSENTYKALESVHFSWVPVAQYTFKYIVFKGRAPSLNDLLTFIADDQLSGGVPMGEADRMAILKVFATLKSEISSSAVLCEKH